MATLAFAAVGAGIGASFGAGTLLGMSYAAFGWNAGALLGGMLFAPKQPDQQFQGPRLGDLKVQASTYGNAIPRIYGSMRIAGNMIWSMPILETAHTTQSGGGKGGGGGGSVTQTNYTYSQSFALALCEGEIVGIRKIWANGKLIYNLSADSDIATLAASNAAAAGLRIYKGTETQTADSLIQADIGAADTPAYRGTAYIVFENLQLADYGNRAPNLEFEVVVAGTSPGLTVGTYEVTPFAAASSGVLGGCEYGGVLHVYSGITYVGASAYKVGHDLYDMGGNLLGNNSYYCANYITVSRDDPDFGADMSGGVLRIYYRGVEIGTYSTNPSYNVYFVYGSKQLAAVQISTGIIGAEYLFVSFVDGVYAGSKTAAVWSHFLAVERETNLIYMIAGTLTAYNAGFGLVDEWSLSGWTYPYGISRFTVKGGVIMVSGPDYHWGTSTATAMNRLNDDGTVTSLGKFTDSLNTAYFQASPYVAITGPYPLIFDPARVSASGPTVASIVTDLCADAGVTAVDASALTATLTGYAIATRSTVRAAIEPLASAFFFDAVESDGEIKFVPRGTATGITLAEDDLAARDDNTAAADAVILERRQEVELPQELNVLYLDQDAAYQTGSQYARRLIGASEDKRTLQLAMAISATKAKQIADVLMYDAWQGRVTFAFATTAKYSYLEPSDVVQITKDSTLYTARITAKNEQGGIISFEAVHEDLQVYSQSAPAPSLPAPSEIVAVAPFIDLRLLDIPLLRDQDDGFGFYAAACAYGPDWRGCQPFKSLDSGASWAQYGPGVLNQSAIGTAATVLGDFTQNIFDELNSVTVILLAGELESITELAVLNGGNAALLGNEILQFRDATLTAANTYKLTGLLRGRQGTEWARSSHTYGDRFILLTSSTTYPMPASNAELGAARKYRGASLGGYLEDALDIDFTFQAIAQECYAPVLLGGGRDAAGNLTLNWVRRTRIGGAWTDYADVPLGEETEAYEIDIYTTSGYTTVVRTLTGITSATASYTAAQQTTDFGSPQATIYWRVYQMSATNGRGTAATGAT